MVQVLHIANGDTILEKLQAKGNRLERLLADGASDERIIEEAYLSALSRPPTDRERTALLAELAAAQKDSAEATERRQVVEDLYWSLLSGKEFLFNH